MSVVSGLFYSSVTLIIGGGSALAYGLLAPANPEQEDLNFIIGLIGSIVLLVATEIFLMTFGAFFQERRFNKNSKFATGEIIEISSDKTGGYTKIKFLDELSIEHVFKEDVHKKSKVGDKVKVQYATRKNGKVDAIWYID
ncbi:MAG: hypothetical protein MJ154_03135 [Candidatus Saccharibacteria bacterium]|nr:hypothetical protein [Candidatus Saccharibacteria bacterium]